MSERDEAFFDELIDFTQTLNFSYIFTKGYATIDEDPNFYCDYFRDAPLVARGMVNLILK